jgi:Protein of unknown function (DUF935)
MATSVIKKEEGTGLKGKKLVVQNFITARPVRRTVFDLGDWRRALEYAEMDNGSRVDLYDLYDDVMLDPHLSAQWQKRIMNITNCDWDFLRDDKEVEELDTLINSPVFEQLLAEIMNTIAWGKTLEEFGNKTINRYGRDEQVLTAYCVKRQHIRPREGMIVKEQYDSVDSSRAIKYREGMYSKYIADIGTDTDLGLILKATPYVLLKRGDVGDWAQFVQLFGMPFREYRYNGYDDATYQLLKKNAEEMGSAPYMILPDGATMTLHDTTSKGTGQGDVFNKLAGFCDKQISILILGNTETTSSSSSSGYAQSETHMKTQIEVYRDDKRYVMRVLNDIVKPILYNLGYPVGEGHFKPVEETNLTEVKDKLAIIKSVKDMGEPVDANHIYEVSGVPKPAAYDSMKAEQEAQKQAEMQAKQTMLPVKGKVKKQKPVKKLVDDEDENWWIKLKCLMSCTNMNAITVAFIRLYSLQMILMIY